MRKLLILIAALAMSVNTTSAAFTETKTETKESCSAFSSAEQKAAAEFFVNLSRKQYEELVNRRLSWLERSAFKFQQKRMRNMLKRANGEGVNAAGFLAGFLFLFLGVLLVYLLSKDANMRKWAWIGTGISIALIGLLFIYLKAVL